MPSRAPRASPTHALWMQADPAWIRRALGRALARPSGGWYVIDASRAVRSEPRRVVVSGRELVAYRAHGMAVVAPAACPHMGADLSTGRVCDGKLVCPWHALALDPRGRPGWRPYPAHDDGVLLWARLDDDAPTEEPIRTARPARSLHDVIRLEAACDPEDVIANRLDPWHGVPFHPHSFARLAMLDLDEDVVTSRVAYRVAGPLCVEVDVTFHAPDPRTIVMTIIEGDGRGSIVETHATPIREGRTAIIEAVFATSDRAGFRAALLAAGIFRRLISSRARRLWADDALYAERRYALRSGRGAR